MSRRTACRRAAHGCHGLVLLAVVRSRLAAIAVTTLLASPICTFARPATQPAVDDATLAAIDAKAGAIRDLTADFTQQKFSPLLRDPITTHGTIASKGDAMLWQSNEPEPTRTRVDTSRLQIYYANRNTVEDYPIAGKLGSLAASPLPRLSALRERFTITATDEDGLDGPPRVASPVMLRLDPKEADVKQYVDHVCVLLDASRGLVVAFELTDPDGERTVIHFANLKTNVGLADDALKLNAPANAEIVKPLG